LGLDLGKPVRPYLPLAVVQHGLLDFYFLVKQRELVVSFYELRS
jgi:hypothetical protein|tara:strand:+ start:3082 stop:3213 length:132 start_codon:yes stop_codon:yes gene_type:complete